MMSRRQYDQQEPSDNQDVYSPPRPAVRNTRQPISPEMDRTPVERRIDSAPFFASPASPSSSSPQIHHGTRKPAAHVNSKLNNSAPAPAPAATRRANSATVSSGGGFRRLPAASQQQRRNNNNTQPTVALVPTPAEMVAIRKIVAREQANPANPDAPYGAFSSTGQRSSPIPATAAPVPRRTAVTPPQQQQHQQQRRGAPTAAASAGSPSSRLQQRRQEAGLAYSPRTPTPDEMEHAINESYERQMRVAAAAAAARHEAMFPPPQKEETKFRPAAARRVTSQQRQLLSEQQEAQQQAIRYNVDQQQRGASRQQQGANNSNNNNNDGRPTYVILDPNGNISDIAPDAIDGARFREAHRRVENNPNGTTYRPVSQDAETGHVTYVVTRGHTFMDGDEERSLEEEYLDRRREEMQRRGPIVSPSLPQYFKPRRPKIGRGEDGDDDEESEEEESDDEENDKTKKTSSKKKEPKKSKEAELLEKQFGELQRQLMENNKQVQAVAEERLRVLSASLTDAEDIVKEERRVIEQLHAELATLKSTNEALTLTLKSERESFVADRDAIRKDHGEHVKALEADWTLKIERANAEIAKFLSSAEFDREQGAHRQGVLQKRIRELEQEVQELEMECALQKEGARRAQLIVEQERAECDDRIVAASTRANGAASNCAEIDAKLTAQLREVHLRLESSMKREAELEGEVGLMMRRMEEMKLELDAQKRAAGDAKAMLELERERTRSLSGHLDAAKIDVQLAENEREARHVLERQNDELERQLSDMRRTVSELMKIASQ